MVETVSFLMQIVLWPLCLGMIGLILLQGGAGDISSAFGGGGMLDSTLGVGASKKMAKVTGWLAAIFFVFVLFLAIPHKGGFGPKPVGPAAAAITGEPASSSPATPPAPSAPVLAPTSAPKLAPVETAPLVTAPVIDAGSALKAVEGKAGEAAAAVEAKVDEAKAAIPAVPAAPTVEAKPIEAPAVPAAEAKPVEAVPASPAK